MVGALGFFMNIHTSHQIIAVNADVIQAQEELQAQSPVTVGSPLSLEPNTNASTLPEWLAKSNTANLTGALIHVGKTGGSSLSLLLRNGCHSFVPKPCRVVPNESLASQLIEKYYHVPDFSQLPDHQHSFYVLTLRDPLDRTLSAFTYHHPANHGAQGGRENSSQRDLEKQIKLYKCFPTLEHFVQHLGDNATDFVYNQPANYLPEDARVHPNCTNFARAALAGKVRPFVHFFFGYQKIASLLSSPVAPSPLDNTNTGASYVHRGATTPTNRALDSQHKVIILATRTEHLIDDWNSVNAALGDKTTQLTRQQTLTVHERKVEHRKLPVSRELSEKGRERLCRALKKEYQVYFQLLRDAINLSDQNVQDSVAYSKRNCPHLKAQFESWLADDIS